MISRLNSGLALRRVFNFMKLTIAFNQSSDFVLKCSYPFLKKICRIKKLKTIPRRNLTRLYRNQISPSYSNNKKTLRYDKVKLSCRGNSS